MAGIPALKSTKERTNAIKLLGLTLQQVQNRIPLNLVQIGGGEKDNAIPRTASAVVCLDKGKQDEFIRSIENIQLAEKNENQSKEKGLFIRVAETSVPEQGVFDADSTARVLSF